MFQHESDFNEEIYASFYVPKTGADGVWELPLVLETVSEASGTTIPLPLPYRRLNAEVLEYLEDVAQLVPRDEEERRRGADRRVSADGANSAGVRTKTQQCVEYLRKRSVRETQTRRKTRHGGFVVRLGVGLCLHARLPDHRRSRGFSRTSDADEHDLGRVSGVGLGGALETV